MGPPGRQKAATEKDRIPDLISSLQSAKISTRITVGGEGGDFQPGPFHTSYCESEIHMPLTLIFAVTVTLVAGLVAKSSADDDKSYLEHAVPNGARVIADTARPGAEYSMVESFFVGEQLVGVRYYWDAKMQQLHSKDLFKDGKRHGIQQKWYDNGQLSSETPYLNGQMHGTCRQWNRDGKLLGSFVMKNGCGVFQTWYPDGQQESVKHFTNGNIDGELKCYFDNGKLFYLITYFYCVVYMDRCNLLAAKNSWRPLCRGVFHPRKSGHANSSWASMPVFHRECEKS